jgi:hypothetical protein
MSVPPSALNRLLAALQRGDVPAMLEDLKIFFAQVPYDITQPRTPSRLTTRGPGRTGTRRADRR